jgi:hypothetical protein
MSRYARLRARDVELKRNSDMRSSFATMHPTTDPCCVDRLLEGHSVSDFRPQDPPNTMVRPDDVPAHGFLVTDLDVHWNSQWERLIQQEGESTHSDIEGLTIKLHLVAFAGHQDGTPHGKRSHEARPPPNLRITSHFPPL